MRRAMQNLDYSRGLYLDLMKRCLLNMIYPQSEEAPSLATHSGFRGRLARTLLSGEEGCGGHISATKSGDHLGRMEGRIWPMVAHTMIGLKRLDNLQFCVDEAITNGVCGDLIETGGWRGGAAIFMRAMLKAYGMTDRRVARRGCHLHARHAQGLW